MPRFLYFFPGGSRRCRRLSVATQSWLAGAVLLSLLAGAAYAAPFAHIVARTPRSAGGVSQPILAAVGASPGARRPLEVATAERAKIANTLAKLPLSFEPNRGQARDEVKFLARAPGYLLQLTATEARLLIRGPVETTAAAPAELAFDSPKEAPSLGITHALRFTWLKTNAHAQPSGEKPLPGTTNYLQGNDASQWWTAIPTYEKVRYPELYPGIDLVYYGNGRQVEYDLIVAPHADPRAARLSLEGAAVTLTENGDLDLTLSAGRLLRLRAPVAYQERAGERTTVAARYQLSTDDRRTEVSFELAAYDRDLPLVIDPLVYSTFLGGSVNDFGRGIAVNAAGEAFVTGDTLDATVDFPTTAGAYTATHNGPVNTTDAFVTRLNAAGSALVYSTFLGGTAADLGLAIAVNAAGEAFVTGRTIAADFPTTAGAFDTTYNLGVDAFVTRLNASGNGLVYSTFLGGGANDYGFGIVVNAANEAFVTGTTTFSATFPTTAGAFDTTHNGGFDVFVTRLNALGNGLVYSTFLGSSSNDIGRGIAINAANEAFLTGEAANGTTAFPTTAGAFDTTHNGGSTKLTDAFVARLNALGNGLVYSTFLGGSNDDAGEGIAVNAASEAFVAGSTISAFTNFPTTPAAYDTSPNGSDDVFVTRLNALGNGLVYSTLLGGGASDLGHGIAVNAADEAFVTGHTADATTDFPTTAGAYDTTHNGDIAAFVTRLNASGNGLVYSTFLGGGVGNDYGRGIAVSAAGEAFVTGETGSSGFPTTAGAFDTSQNGVVDAFVAKLSTGLPPANGDFYTLAPCRVVDTRGGAPIGGPVLTHGSQRTLALAGKCLIPSAARAVSINITAIGPLGPGSLVLYPLAGAATNTTAISFNANTTRANNAVFGLNALGELQVLPSVANPAGPDEVHLVVDVNGYFD